MQMKILMVLLCCVILHAFLIWTMVIIFHCRKVLPPRFPVSLFTVPLLDCMRYIGSGDLLLVRTRTLNGEIIHRTLRSWYTHIALVLRMEDEPGEPLRVLEVDIPGRRLLPLEDWFILYREELVAWRKLYCRDEEGRVRTGGLQAVKNRATVQWLTGSDDSYPTFLESAVRRLPHLSLTANSGRLNCSETVAQILKYAGVLRAETPTNQWTPMSYCSHILDRHLSPGVHYVLEQQVVPTLVVSEKDNKRGAVQERQTGGPISGRGAPLCAEKVLCPQKEKHCERESADQVGSAVAVPDRCEEPQPNGHNGQHLTDEGPMITGQVATVSTVLVQQGHKAAHDPQRECDTQKMDEEE